MQGERQVVSPPTPKTTHSITAQVFPTNQTFWGSVMVSRIQGRMRRPVGPLENIDKLELDLAALWERRLLH